MEIWGYSPILIPIIPTGKVHRSRRESLCPQGSESNYAKGPTPEKAKSSDYEAIGFVTEVLFYRVQAASGIRGDQAAFSGIGGQGGGVVHIQLGHEAGTVLFDGFGADIEHRGDLFVRVPLPDQLQDFFFP